MLTRLKFTDKLCNFWWDKCAIGMALISPEGKFLKVNPSLCIMVKYSRSELLNKTFHDITHRDDLQADMENAKNVAENKMSSYEMTKRYITKLDEVIWVRIIVHGICKNFDKVKNCDITNSEFSYYFVQIIKLDKRFVYGIHKIIKGNKSNLILLSLIKDVLKGNWKIITAFIVTVISIILNKLFFQLEKFIN